MENLNLLGSLLNYKELVQDILLGEGGITREVCELRLSLFVEAFRAREQRPLCLSPFPPAFFNTETKSKEMDHLEEIIAGLPPFEEIMGGGPLPQVAWELLHWVFTNPLTIEAIKDNIPSKIEAIKEETSLSEIPAPNNGIYLFKVTPSIPKIKFEAEKAAYGSFFAYHGSPLANFHSIIHRGLKEELNVKSSYGKGTYLSSKLSVSKGYAAAGEGWVHCDLKKRGWGDQNKSSGKSYLRCVSVVEVVDHPNLIKKYRRESAATYFIAEKDEWLQLSYLILYLASDTRK